MNQRTISGYKFGQPTSYSSFHLGVDYRAPTGTPLYAPENGTIIDQYVGQGGKTIVLRGQSGYTYRFMHLFSFSGSKRPVTEGEKIGTCDNTGLSDFAHLHLDLTKPGLTVDSNKKTNFVDPEQYIWNTAGNMNEKLIMVNDVIIPESKNYRKKGTEKIIGTFYYHDPHQFNDIMQQGTKGFTEVEHSIDIPTLNDTITSLESRITAMNALLSVRDQRITELEQVATPQPTISVEEISTLKNAYQIIKKIIEV